jgi:secondary thiamine-phosphate synthase enzyme
MEKLFIKTQTRESILDITSMIQEYLNKVALQDGICMVYNPHTTAAVTINENADPTVKSDMLSALSELIPRNKNYRHSEGNSDSHIKSALVGTSVMIPVEKNRLQLGSWQGIMFCEFDGPRNREIWIKFIGSGH